MGRGALSINNDNFACSNRRGGIELNRISSGLLLTSHHADKSGSSHHLRKRGTKKTEGGNEMGWRVVGRRRRALNDVLIDFLVFRVQGSARKLKWQGGNPQGCCG